MIWCTLVHPIRVIHKMILGEMFCPYLKIVLVPVYLCQNTDKYLNNVGDKKILKGKTYLSSYIRQSKIILICIVVTSLRKYIH